MRFRAFSRQQRRVLTLVVFRRGQSREAVICDGAVRSGRTTLHGAGLLPVGHGLLRRHGLRAVRQNHHGALRRGTMLREVLPTLGALGFQWRSRHPKTG